MLNTETMKILPFPRTTLCSPRQPAQSELVQSKPPSFLVASFHHFIQIERIHPGNFNSKSKNKVIPVNDMTDL